MCTTHKYTSNGINTVALFTDQSNPIYHIKCLIHTHQTEEAPPCIVFVMQQDGNSEEKIQLSAASTMLKTQAFYFPVQRKSCKFRYLSFTAQKHYPLKKSNTDIYFCFGSFSVISYICSWTISLWEEGRWVQCSPARSQHYLCFHCHSLACSLFARYVSSASVGSGAD